MYIRLFFFHCKRQKIPWPTPRKTMKNKKKEGNHVRSSCSIRISMFVIPELRSFFRGFHAKNGEENGEVYLGGIMSCYTLCSKLCSIKPIIPSYASRLDVFCSFFFFCFSFLFFFFCSLARYLAANEQFSSE